MNLRRSHVGLTFTKELRETLRDRRTVMVMILFPLVVYPVLSLGVTQVMASRSREQQARAAKVAIEAPPPVADDVRRRLTKAPARITIVDSGQKETSEQIESRALDAVVRAVPGGTNGAQKLEIVYDGTLDDSRAAEDRVSDRLTCALPDAQTPLYSLAKRDLAPKAKTGGYLLSKVLPLVLVLMVLLGAFYPAIDVTAGERERGTLETSLSAPIKRRDLLLGKVLAVVVLATITGALNLVSMSLTVRQLMHIADPSAALPVPWARAAATSLVIVPCAFLFGSVFIAMGAMARGFKEAQNLLMPAYLLLFSPALLGALGELPLFGPAAFVPGMNVTLLARDIALGSASATGTLLVLGSTLAYGLVALSLAARLYASEGFLDLQARAARKAQAGKTQPQTGETSAAEALSLFAVAYLLLYFVFIPMQQRSQTPGLLASQWLGMLGLVLAFARLRRRSPIDVLRLRPPAPRALLGGVLVGVSAFAAAGLLTDVVLPPPKEVIEHLRKTVVEGGGDRGLWASLFLIAVTPAICEESLFRGPILRGLATRLGPIGVVVTNGLMFGLFHIDVWRLLPTSLLGVVLATLALRSGSLWTSVAAHLCNNAILVLLARSKLDGWLETLGRPAQVAIFVVASGLTWLGLFLSGEPRKGQGDGASNVG